VKKNFRELEARMDPERLSRAKERARSDMADMLLAELRRHAGMTQEELAAALGIKQPSLSKIESQSDMHVSTLQSLIEALGGRLEIIAHMPGGDVRVTQFVPRAG
jgi:transcriptional regulator with XRE-family HTH domain